MDWTHTDLIIKDIRKLKQLYAISIDHEDITGSILINSDIFDERLKSFFLREPRNITRGEILAQKWNMYVTKGFYVKQDLLPGGNLLTEFPQNPEKWYVSFLEIAGPLGSFDTILSKSPKN